MLSFLLILTGLGFQPTAFASMDSDFARVQRITDSCRPRCDSSLVSITGEEIAKLWQKEIDNAPKTPKPAASPTATPDLHIRYNRLGKQIDQKKQEWLKCKPTCSSRFLDGLGQLWLDYWDEGQNPQKPAEKK
jgi:hypothetical protein